MDSRRFAFLVGSYEYALEPALHRLQGPPNDIAALAAILIDPAIGAFSTETSVNEPSATVLEKVEGFLSDRERDDIALLYFSGHGVKATDGELYFAMANTRLNRLRATALKARDIHDLLRASRARQQLLLLDCCYSGAFAKGMVVRSGGAAGTVDYFDGRGHAVLTASDSIQYAFEDGTAADTEGEAPQSIFTRVLVDGLSSGDADIDRDGVVTVDELYDYLHEHVRRRNPSQTPRKWALDQQGKVVIARVAAPQLKATQLPPELLQTIADIRHWVRGSAVDQLKQFLGGGHIGLALAAQEALLRLAEDDSKTVASAAALALQQHKLRTTAAAVPRSVSDAARPAEYPPAEAPTRDTLHVESPPRARPKPPVRPMTPEGQAKESGEQETQRPSPSHTPFDRHTFLKPTPPPPTPGRRGASGTVAAGDEPAGGPLRTLFGVRDGRVDKAHVAFLGAAFWATDAVILGLNGSFSRGEVGLVQLFPALFADVALAVSAALCFAFIKSELRAAVAAALLYGVARTLVRMMFGYEF